MNIFETSTFWALVSLILFFLILFYYKIHIYLRDALDKRAKRISDELEEARRLREEAQQLLAEYQKKRHEAEKEAGDILASAKRQAQNIVADMREQTKEYIIRRNKLAEQRIAQAEHEATRLIRSSAIDKAVSAAGVVMMDKIKANKSENDRLFRLSLSDVEAKLKKAS